MHTLFYFHHPSVFMYTYIDFVLYICTKYPKHSEELKLCWYFGSIIYWYFVFKPSYSENLTCIFSDYLLSFAIYEIHDYVSFYDKKLFVSLLITWVLNFNQFSKVLTYAPLYSSIVGFVWFFCKGLYPMFCSLLIIMIQSSPVCSIRKKNMFR